MAQGRSTEIISMIEWIRTRRLSMKNSLWQMKIAREEIFGPVMCILKFDSEEEVIPAPCTLHPAPCTLHLAPCTLHPAPCSFL